MTKSEDSAVEAYHKLMEAMKFAYGTWKYFGDSNDTKLNDARYFFYFLRLIKGDWILLMVAGSRKHEKSRIRRNLEREDWEKGARTPGRLRFHDRRAGTHWATGQGRNSSNQCY